MFDKQKKKILKHFRKKSWFNKLVHELYISSQPTLNSIGVEYNELGEDIFYKYDQAIARSLLNKSIIAREVNLLEREAVCEDCKQAIELYSDDEDFFQAAFEIVAKYSVRNDNFRTFLHKYEKLNYSCVNKAIAMDAIKRGNSQQASAKVNEMYELGQVDCLRRIPAFVPYMNDASEDEKIIFEALHNNPHKKDFLDLFKNETVCIVGNGPCEIGKASGETIDSHKHIVRFNSFSIDEKFHKDYGKRTTIWARNATTKARNDLPNDLEYVVFGHELMYDALPESVVSEIPRLCSKYKVLYLDGSEAACELVSKTGIKSLTLGTQMIALRYKLSGKIDDKSIYGFAFGSPSGKKEVSHYYKTTKKGRFFSIGHEWEMEKEIYFNMLNGKKYFD